MFAESDVISSYSRAQAIEDGVLVDVSGLFPDLIQNAGFKYPIAMTSAAFNACVWPVDNEEEAAKLERLCQDTKGRMWDVLWMLKYGIAKSQAGDLVNFELRVRQPNNRLTIQRLKSMCHGGDAAEPVITIMLPDED
jgi:hypothetical protein